MTTSAPTAWWPALVRRYGWRAYAVPALALTTLVVVLRPTDGHTSTPTAAAPAPAAVRAAAPAVETLSAPVVMAGATPDAARCAGNTAAQLILVSITSQHAWMCSGTTLALSTAVTTGADQPDRETRPGTWHIQGKQTDRDLSGPGYVEHVDYWMPYDGDFGLHDASFQTFDFGDTQWKTDGSHGCVHFPTPAMAWVYQWAGVGTQVTISA